MVKTRHFNNSARDCLIKAALKLLLPLVRLLLRHGVSYPVADSLLRWAYVDVAAREFGIEGRMQSKSRVAVLTGMTRREVGRLFDAPAPAEVAGPERFNRAARVLSGWREDGDFLDDDGQPRVLPLGEGDGSFTELVRRYSGNAPPRAVLDELIRVGSVTEDAGRVRLLRAYYVPPAGRESDAAKFEILGMSAADLIRTVGHNLAPGETGPFFQRVVYTRAMPVAMLNEARAALREEGQALADRADSRIDELSRQGPADDTCRAGIGVYYFEDPADEAGI